MKVVFLDIDGVLNTARSIVEHDRNLELGLSSRCDEDVVKVLDEDAVDNLLTLLDKTGAKIVLSSNWRTMQSVERLQELFEPRRFGKHIVDKTDHGSSRGEEIQIWLEGRHDVDSFVILDDLIWDIVDLFPDNVIECSISVGFGDKNLLNQAIKILGEKF